ncbi:MAG: magnesium protoporphyrin IX methyltransferase [Anaerolineae bacterium]
MEMMVDETSAHKAHLQEYFDTLGFERWSAIYDGHSELSSVRQSVREGHAEMLSQAQVWLQQTCEQGGTLLDVGCGTGLFSVAQAQQGFDVTAVDIAPRMVTATVQSAECADVAGRIEAQVGDIESTQGHYDVVVCFDVLIHYPPQVVEVFCQHLAERTQQTLLLTYAPYNALLAGLHWIGGMFPRSQRRTEIQMIRDHDIDRILSRAQMRVVRRQRVSCGFYHVMLLQAVPN